MISIPFSGNKRYSYKNVKQIVQEHGYDKVFEPFGGSCVLSVNLFNDGLVQKAVVNDFDHFFDLYPEYLDLKDKVVAEGYKRGLCKILNRKNEYLKIYPDGHEEKVERLALDEKDRAILQDIIKEYVPENMLKYFFLGSNFVFGARGSSSGRGGVWQEIDLQRLCLLYCGLNYYQAKKIFKNS